MLMLPGAWTAALQCSLRLLQAGGMLQDARFGDRRQCSGRGAPTQVALRLPLVQREILLHGRGLVRANPIVLTKQVLHSTRPSLPSSRQCACWFHTRLCFAGVPDFSVPCPRSRRTHGGSCWSMWTFTGQLGALTRWIRTLAQMQILGAACSSLCLGLVTMSGSMQAIDLPQKVCCCHRKSAAAG